MSIQGVPFNKVIAGVGTTGSTSVSRENPGVDHGPSFRETLDQLKKPIISPQGLEGGVQGALTFSSHAVDRMRSRGVHFGPEQMQKLNSAIEKARAKGAKETLVLADNAALIVSVKNNKVVTVMDSQALKENVFTNIDSTVVI